MDENKPEEKKESDLDARIEAFIKGYGALVDEHQVDFAAYPVYMPDGQGGFRTSIQNSPVDIKNKPVKSPFVAQ